MGGPVNQRRGGGVESFTDGLVENKKVGDERGLHVIKDKSTVGSSAALIRHHQGPMTVSLNSGCRDGIVSLTLIWVGKQQK